MKTAHTILTISLLATGAALAGNPIVSDVGMADPHIRIFNGRAFLYSTRDSDPAAKVFTMPDWHVWSSDDLVEWRHETVISPSRTYIGRSERCWATDCVGRDGRYFLYFSNGNTDTGVMVGPTPTGPFSDALGQPLLPQDLVTTKEYDPSVLIDDDGSAYIVFGHHRDGSEDHYYAVARLGSDMISLAEPPREVHLQGSAPVLRGNDKPTLHKRGNLYYLSAGSHYATSENVYGPYRKVGDSGNGAFGLNARAHGNYFEWRNQSFHTWCHFHLGKETARYRESYITYLHYRDNGEMVDDVDYLSRHFATGVGQYDASWDRIEAEWFMAAQGCRKLELGDSGFQVVFDEDGAYLRFPHLQGMPPTASLLLRVAAEKQSSIAVRHGSAKGRLLGRCVIGPAAGGAFAEVACPLLGCDFVADLHLVAESGEADANIRLDRFCILSAK